MIAPRFVKEFYGYNKKRLLMLCVPSTERDEAISKAEKYLGFCERGMISPNEAVQAIGECFRVFL